MISKQPPILEEKIILSPLVPLALRGHGAGDLGVSKYDKNKFICKLFFQKRYIL
ncbi:hypothetical protein NIES267_03230 [Calothrix parasitica NIES-267]|uniref:Uncharacterized protein n=1 Tax=Calothrix parasitica NIES-267 TaxID=1973488 RepID=A0A1Z4LID8_9CYAN|nr:hypothetical protein NIES267_03230 [Calothrix parasitica NIES-267]